MMNSSRLQITERRRGLYETFDLRGESADGRYAFLLKHVLFRSLWRGTGVVEVAAMGFDRKTGRRACVVERETVTPAHLRQLGKVTGWEQFAISFGTGSFVDISPARLRGKLHVAGGAASWSLDRGLREPSPGGGGDFSWRHPWPRHGIEAESASRSVTGHVNVADMVLDGDFLLTTQHYWGDGYPHEFASGHCTRFEGESGAAFYGFSTRLSLGRLKSPYLGMAALLYRGRRYAFDSMAGSFRHRLESLDNYRWRVTFLNGDYGLEVRADGQNPRMTPWLAWHADHPAGGRSVVKATPFAQAELVLFHRRNQERIALLKSGSMMLKTLLPENAPEGGGFSAEA